MKYNKLIPALLLMLCIIPKSYAYSTVVFELSNKAGEKVEHKVSIDGRWLRIDSKPEGKADFILLDTGFHRFYEVYDKDKKYQLTHVGRLYWPETPLLSPRFKLLRKNKAVAGKRCQPVNEISADKQAIAEHCMATGGALGLNAREMNTLSRLLTIMRRKADSLQDSWIGAASPDERQISILSEDTDGNRMEIKSVNHDKIDYRSLQIPKSFKEMKPVQPADSPLLSGHVHKAGVPEPEKPVKN